jgi:hypothetical protein
MHNLVTQKYLNKKIQYMNKKLIIIYIFFILSYVINIKYKNKYDYLT